jgi:hypothetical protein
MVNQVREGSGDGERERESARDQDCCRNAGMGIDYRQRGLYSTRLRFG